MPTIVCVHIPFGRVYFKARGVKKDSVLDMIKVELTYAPIKGGINCNQWASTNNHRAFWACSEFRACAQNFLASINIAVMLGFPQT